MPSGCLRTGAIVASVLATDGPSDAGGADERFAAIWITGARAAQAIAAARHAPPAPSLALSKRGRRSPLGRSVSSHCESPQTLRTGDESRSQCRPLRALGVRRRRPGWSGTPSCRR